MTIRFKGEGIRGFQQALEHFPERLHSNLEKELRKLGEREVEYIKKEKLSGPTGSSTTQIRSGQRRDAYGHATEVHRGGVKLFVGPERAPRGRVPLQSRIWEGYDRHGNFRTQWTIVPVKAKALRFPVRDPYVTGLAQATILEWVTTKRVNVQLQDRATLPLVRADLERDIGPVVQKAVDVSFRIGNG